MEFYFETYNELSEKIYLCLTIELMGKHSNIILYNYDTNIIIGCAHNVGAEKSRVRELIGGLPYAYPPKNLSAKHFTSLMDIFSQNFNINQISVNDSIDNHFANYQESEKVKILKSKLFSVINSKLKKAINSISKLVKQTSTQDKTENYRKKGDLIMANLALLKDKEFSNNIEIIDWETNLPLKIELNENKSLKENANNYFKLYNKAKASLNKSLELTNELNAEKRYLEQILYSIEHTQTLKELFEIQEEVSAISNSQSKTLINTKKHSEEKIFSTKINNFTVYVGKNNKQNDYIISKLARDKDLWFHTSKCAGSHILLRVEGNQEIDEKTIFECANLAKNYSSAKNSSKVGVIYTQVKNLKKPPGGRLGYVTYKGEKEIIID